MLPNLNFPPNVKPPGLEPSASSAAAPATVAPPVPVPLAISPGAAKESQPPVVEGDRRSSSIAALRLKAREHEFKLEQLRQSKCNEDSSN